MEKLNAFLTKVSAFVKAHEHLVRTAAYVVGGVVLLKMIGC